MRSWCLGSFMYVYLCHQKKQKVASIIGAVQSDWCANIFCSFHAIAKYERRYKGCQSPDRRVVNEVR